MAFYQELELWAKSRESDIRKDYENEKDTGALANSLSSEIEKISEGYRIVFRALSYAYEKEYGRGETKSKIKTDFFIKLQGWVSRHMTYKNEKQLKSITYLIWRKIHRFGIKVPNSYSKGGYVEKYINQQEIKKLLSNLSDSMIKEIKETLFNTKQWQ